MTRRPRTASTPARESTAIARYFADDRQLYDAYAAMCRSQFRADLQAGDAACLAGDAKALERLGHNLKTVLRSLGFDTLAEGAARLEDASHAGRTVDAAAAWNAMRDGVGALIDSLPDGGDGIGFDVARAGT